MKKIISSIVIALFFVPAFVSAQNTITLEIGSDLSAYQNCDSFESCPGFRDALVEALTELLKQLLAEKIAEAQESVSDPVDYSDFQDATYQVLSSGNLAGENIGVVPEVIGNIWTDFKMVVPTEYLDTVSYVRVFYDDESDFLAHVKTSSDSRDTWELGVNLFHFNEASIVNEQRLVGTLVHEASHIITLSTDEIDISVSERRCGTYYTVGGCAYKNSYINEFIDAFWDNDDFDNSEDIQDESDENEKDEIADDYFEKTGDYVTPYATWHPDEDIAESFAYFVLQDKPASDAKEVDAKLLFFHGYPELVTMRTNIRTNFADLFNF